MENANADLGGLASLVPKAAAASTAALHLLLVVFGGVYLAANPALYRRGLLKLLPERARPPVAGFLDTSARALRLWLLIFAAPLTVLLATAAGQLYVRDALGTPTQVPGERDRFP